MTTKAEEKEEEISFIDDESETIVDLSPAPTEPNRPDPTAERLARAEAETARLRDEIAASRSQNYNIPRSAPQRDDFDSELESLNEKQHAMAIQWEMDKASGKLRDKSVVDDYNRKAREIEDAKASVHTRRAMRDMMPEVIRQQQQQQLRQQYSDVYNNQHALTYAEGAYKMLLASGEQDGPQLLDKAMNQARVQFRMPGANYMKPTQADKDRLSGIPGGGGRNTVDNKVRMGKAEKQMAMAMYGEQFNGDEKKAYQTWAKGPGLRAKKKASQLRNG